MPVKASFVRELPKQHEAQISCVDFSPDGRTLASASWDETVVLVDVHSGFLRRLHGHKNWVSCVAFSPDADSARVASCGLDATTIVWDATTGNRIATFADQTDVVFRLAWSADGRLLATASEDRSVVVYADLAMAKTITDHNCSIHALCFSGDGAKLAAGCTDNHVRIWAWRDDAAAIVLQGHADEVQFVAFTTDNEVVSASRDNTIRVWDVEARKSTAVIATGNTELWAAALSRSRTFMVTGESNEDDSAVRIVDLAEPHEHFAVVEHRKTVQTVAISPNDELIAVAGDDMVVQLWRAKLPIKQNRAKIEIFPDLLGKGHFGSVYRGAYNNGLCAVKTLRDSNDETVNEIRSEFQLMKAISFHPNVLQYSDLCVETDRILLIMQFCAHGSLQKYVHSNPNVAAVTLTHFAVDIAAGMSHLSQLLVHRDLATRNILLDCGPPPFNMTAKIGDFGLARPIRPQGYYRILPTDKVVTPWSPNEVVDAQDRRHTPASDVWMFATLLWEMFSGTKEYPKPNRKQEPPLDQPARCPDTVYALMTRCWAIDPTRRPVFDDVHRALVVALPETTAPAQPSPPETLPEQTVPEEASAPPQN